MERFSINPARLSPQTLMDCILEGSAFAVKTSVKKYYTHKGEPKNWMDEFVSDIQGADNIDYNGHKLNGVKYSEGGAYSYFIYEGQLFYFDSYFSDCPILAEILKR